jgi:hypothetical protein
MNKINLHGHCHGSLMKDPNYEWYYTKKVTDVGCCMTDYTPLHYTDLKQMMATKEIEKVGHH